MLLFLVLSLNSKGHILKILVKNTFRLSKVSGYLIQYFIISLLDEYERRVEWDGNTCGLVMLWQLVWVQSKGRSQFVKC